MKNSLKIDANGRTVTLDRNSQLTYGDFHYYSMKELWEKLSLGESVHPDKWFEQYAGLYYCDGFSTQGYSDNPEDYDEDGNCLYGDACAVPLALYAYLCWAIPDFLEDVLKQHLSGKLNMRL